MVSNLFSFCLEQVVGEVRDGPKPVKRFQNDDVMEDARRKTHSRAGVKSICGASRYEDHSHYEHNVSFDCQEFEKVVVKLWAHIFYSMHWNNLDCQKCNFLQNVVIINSLKLADMKKLVRTTCILIKNIIL